jgi:hypothetical protein
MPFNIPDLESLPRFTVAALNDLGLEAAAEFDSLTDEVTPETVTDEQLDRLQDLKDFTAAVDTEKTSRKTRSSRFSALTTPVAPLAEATEEEVDEEGEKKEEKPASLVAGATDVVTPTLADITTANGAPVLEDAPTDALMPHFTILAAPETGFNNGQELDDWDQVARAFIARSRTHSGNSAQQSTVATIKRDFPPEFTLTGGENDAEYMKKIDFLRDEKRLEGGSLLAGVGWCAPSQIVYTTCNMVTADGLLNLPEIGAPRGGIKHNQGIQFSTIFGSGTGFNILTEAQVIADTAKTCVAIPCPSFVDDRLKVSVLCLTGDILQDRGYPEFVSEFMQSAIAVQAHVVNKQIITDIIADSTAVTLTGFAPWATDLSVVSQVMSAVETAVMDIRYNLRLSRDATIEFVFPYWLRAQLRADFLRRNAQDDYDLADAQMDAMLAKRGARAQWVYDWQDAFATSAVSGSPGSATPITELPTSLQFLAFPAGTWVIARQDVIRLDTIYDSTNITTNKVTQLFLEDGFKAMRFCTLSRVYTVNICPSGSTGVQRIVSC